jgi:hypothetical protein
MVQTGKIVGRKIAVNRDGEKKVLLLSCEITDPDDVQTVEYFQQAGTDNEPPDGSTVLLVKVGSAWKIAIAVDDGIEPDPSLLPGEFEYYSSLLGVKKASIKGRKTGQLELNGIGDYAVKFNQLKTAFDQLKSDFDNHVSKYNGHTHTTTATVSTGLPGVIAPTTDTSTPTTADIDPAKAETIEVPL